MRCSAFGRRAVFWGGCSLRSWRDSWAGERQSCHIPSLAKPAWEFASGKAASEIRLFTNPLTASPLVFTASLPKQKHSRAKSRQLRRLGRLPHIYQNFRPITFLAFRHRWNTFVGMQVTYNNRGPQLSYDWLLQKHPQKPPCEALLKIKRYGTGLTQRVSMEDGSSG